MFACVTSCGWQEHLAGNLRQHPEHGLLREQLCGPSPEHPLSEQPKSLSSTGAQRCGELPRCTGLTTPEAMVCRMDQRDHRDKRSWERLYFRIQRADALLSRAME